ncbi:peptidylprolyl isomerase [Sediminihabitans luteus]|uniref:Peptidyl-prolyl cis-trans isomerase n=1 Tax=Sediminihabitans luteus TaxID=1138585 RepID=A0A2M9CE01_9CELL|nr:FKBP-type peptidyl-prolyl cis-trans isomerase [Sediminihabitans luteus]PJJ70080.1 peptidylprolyl isomerase [Sediminihabitans luteus]GIJ00136.1 peptidylprolyl isomerase [Sediminihabitans luteus]
MKHRTARGMTALALGAALVLTGCADDSDSTDAPSATSTDAASDTPTPTAEDVAAVEAVKVEGDAGSEPTVTFDKGLTVSVPTATVVTPGTGADLEDGQSISMDYVSYTGADATKAGSTYEGDPDTIILGDQGIIPALNQVLEGQKVGVRAVIAIPAQDPSTGEATTSVLALEVTDAIDVPDRATGEAVTPPAGLPTVTLDDTGKPSIEIPKDYEEPTELVAQTLIKGDGAVVKETDTITAHYTGWLTDGTQFDSSWDRGAPASFSLTGVIKGWTQGLAGQTVGSQVLLVIPSDLGYGETASGSIPANSTLVFVVDILAVN